MSFTKEIPFSLTDDEVREYSEQMARGVQDLEAMKKGRKIEIKRRNVEILALQEQVNDLADKVDSGVEMREVECEWCPDYKAGMMNLTCLDTLEIIASRAMEDCERQPPLPENEEKAA
jgi:hypothetical protein